MTKIKSSGVKKGGRTLHEGVPSKIAGRTIWSHYDAVRERLLNGSGSGPKAYVARQLPGGGMGGGKPAPLT